MADFWNQVRTNMIVLTVFGIVALVFTLLPGSLTCEVSHDAIQSCDSFAGAEIWVAATITVVGLIGTLIAHNAVTARPRDEEPVARPGAK